MGYGKGRGSLVKALVGREVTVCGDHFKVAGRLLTTSEGQRVPVHLPGVLIVETPNGSCIIREWFLIVFKGGLSHN